MTETLAEKTCTPCRGGIPPLTRDEAQRLQAQAPNWELPDDAHCIECTFRFRNFRSPLFRKSVSSPGPKAIIPTSASAGVTAVHHFIVHEKIRGSAVGSWQRDASRNLRASSSSVNAGLVRHTSCLDQPLASGWREWHFELLGAANLPMRRECFR
jgi:hypothetical protein